MFPAIPPDIPAWWYCLCVGASVLIIGISKAGFGAGVGILAVPLMALVMPPQQMLGVLLPVLILADILSNIHYLRECAWTILWRLVLGAIVGVGVGTVLLWLMRQSDIETFSNILSVLIGGMCLLWVGVQAYRLLGGPDPPLASHPLSGVAVGLVAGTISTISHAAGPIVGIYLLQLKLPKRTLVSTLLLYFLLINTAKLPTFVSMNLINQQTLLDSIWFIPLLPIGVFAGVWMNKRIAEKPFAMVMYVITSTAAVAMVYKAIT